MGDWWAVYVLDFLTLNKPTLLLSWIILIITACSVPDATEEQNAAASPKPMSEKTDKKVTGIGGIFFKCKDPEQMRNWYKTNLGLVTNEYGSLFEFRNTDEPDKKGYLQWSPFGEKTKYFEPSEKDFMINYRVENIEALVEALKEAGVEVVDSIESFEYGKFVHIMDPEGNKIELWEPVDQVFTDEYEGKTTH